MKKIFLWRYGFIIKSVSLFFITLALISQSFPETGGNTTSPNNNEYADSLVKKAFELKLYEERYWHILMHYKRSIFGLRSLIDDPAFFCSDKGKYDPKSELEATIRAFFTPVIDEKIHPVCNFAARFGWLKEKLEFDLAKFPVSECITLKTVIDNIKPESVSMIFPTYHMNSPASMFGHTLLVIDTENKSRLLAYAVNYSAQTGESFGLFFAFKGIFGLYKGYFSVLPYYTKVQEYGQINQRDIWEYNLNFTKDEVIRMILHLRELENIYSDYYFFDENCSYDILFLLEAARPSLNLTGMQDPWVIPVDTVWDTYNSNLIDEIVYRPSKATKIKHILSLLDIKNIDIAMKILNKKLDPDAVADSDIPLKEKIYICDLAREALQYKYAKKQVPKDEYSKLFIKISESRSRLGNPDESEYVIPKPPQPLDGHRANRAAFGAGINEDDVFSEIKWRAAFHDLMDPDDGFLAGSQIQFCNIAARYYYKERKVKLDRWDFIDVFSLAPVDRFFKPVSWKVNTGLCQKEMRDEKEHLVYALNTGGGYTLDIKYIGLCYAMAGPEFNLGDDLHRNYALGIGGTAGIISTIANVWKLQVYARDIYYGLGDKHNELEIAFNQNLKVTTNNSIRLELSGIKSFSSLKKEARLYWNFYY